MAGSRGFAGADTTSAEADPEERRHRSTGLRNALLVALAVGALTTALGWALAPADERAPRLVTDPSMPAVLLPTLAVDATPSRMTRPGGPSPAGSTATPSPDRTPSPTSTVGRTPVSAGPTATRPPELPELTPLPASQERDLHSVDGGPETTVDFVNDRNEQVTVYRLNRWGYRVRVERLASGESHRQATYVGHPWVVTDRHGEALAVFQPIAEPARAVVR